MVGHPLLTRALSDSPLDCRLTGCSSFLPARPFRAITRSVMQKPTQSVGSEIHGREQRPYTKVEFILYTKKVPPKGGTLFWWAIQDLNPGPSGYEPPALTN